MVKKTLLKTNIKRDKEKLYFCGTTDDGYITVGEAEMKRGRKKKIK
jgi:hypothetical protein